MNLVAIIPFVRSQNSIRTVYVENSTRFAGCQILSGPIEKDETIFEAATNLFERQFKLEGEDSFYDMVTYLGRMRTDGFFYECMAVDLTDKKYTTLSKSIRFKNIIRGIEGNDSSKLMALCFKLVSYFKITIS